jgi:hypothetical protein
MSKKIIYYVEKEIDISKSGLFSMINGEIAWLDGEKQKWDLNIEYRKQDLKVVKLDTYLKHLNPDGGYFSEYDRGVLEYFKKKFYEEVLDESYDI